NFIEQLPPFPGDRRLDIGEPRDVMARSRQACYEATGDWLSNDSEHDRDRARLRHERADRRSGATQNHIRPQRNQLFCESLNAVNIGTSPAVLDLHVAADNPPQLSKPAVKSSNLGLS